MGDNPRDTTDTVFDASPYLKLVIDKDGRWFQNGAEIIHPAIFRQFCSSLEKTSDGGYQVRMGREICRVEVEDAPFVVHRLMEDRNGDLTVQLNDDSVEPFSPAHFWIGKENVPYMQVKQGTFHARFSRPAYYQLARYIVSDDAEKEFFIVIRGRRWSIKREGEDPVSVC